MNLYEAMMHTQNREGIGEIKSVGIDSSRKSFPGIFHVKFVADT